MINTLQIFLLGAVAGFTIFIGLPVSLIRRLDDKKKGFLNALSIGILVFIVVEVLSDSWENVSSSLTALIQGQATGFDGILKVISMFSGLALGLIGLSVYEGSYMSRAAKEDRLSPFRVATLIALGIGAHNFSEGLAIGQSYASGAIGLALILVIGFGIHNATEGFGIVAPLTGSGNRPPISFLARVGLIGGGPTFIGTVIGSVYFSEFTYILFLSLAGGALIYVIMVMYSSGRKQATNEVLMAGIFLGLLLGFLTDILISAAGL